MKTISEMAVECGCTYHSVYAVILDLRLTPIDYSGKERYYHRSQIDLIYKTLYFKRKCDILTIESKMNYETN